MKAKIHIKIYKDKPIWDTAASGQIIVDLSKYKFDYEAIAKEAEKLFLNLLKEIENEKDKAKEIENEKDKAKEIENEKDKAKEKDNRPECEGNNQKAEEAKG